MTSAAQTRLAAAALLWWMALGAPSLAAAEADATTGVTASTGATADAAEAQPRATASRAVAVWGPSNVGDGAEIARQTLRQRLPAGEPLPARVLSLSDWLQAPEFQISGNGEEVVCVAAASDVVVPVGRTELDELTARGLALLDDLEPESAIKTFALAAQRLPCQQEFLSTEAIARLPFYAGIAAYLHGDTEAAAHQFRQSAAMDPAHPWDSSYPTEPQSTFLSAVQEIVAAPKARVFGDMRGTAYVEVWLDGQRLDLDKAIEREVMPGVHLVQALDEGSRWHSFAYRLDSGGKLLLFSAAGLEHTILDGPDGVLSTLATAMLRERGANELLTELYVLRLHPDELSAVSVRAFDPRSGTWTTLRAKATAQTSVEPEAAEPGAGAAPAPALTEATPAPALAKKSLSKRQEAEQQLLRAPRYRSGAAASFKLFQLRRCPAADSNTGRCPNGSEPVSNYIGGTVLIDLRMIKGLNLDIRLGMTATDLKLGGTLLPEVGIGIKYRFLTGSLQPYLGGGADFFAGTIRESIDDSTNTVVIYAGVQGFGGLDIEFSDGFRLTVEGGGGAIINPDEGSDAWLSDGTGSEVWPMGHFMIGVGRFM